ncbi:Hypothetical protein PBC10988_12990 [Planctomycetales bacterium 10988]|nr:Hypothetical protein PBC10988_12990 [Planctomycetales bacterium 10988]
MPTHPSQPAEEVNLIKHPAVLGGLGVLVALSLLIVVYIIFSAGSSSSVDDSLTEASQVQPETPVAPSAKAPRAGENSTSPFGGPPTAPTENSMTPPEGDPPTATPETPNPPTSTPVNPPTSSLPQAPTAGDSPFTPSAPAYGENPFAPRMEGSTGTDGQSQVSLPQNVEEWKQPEDFLTAIKQNDSRFGNAIQSYINTADSDEKSQAFLVELLEAIGSAPPKPAQNNPFGAPSAPSTPSSGADLALARPIIEALGDDSTNVSDQALGDVVAGKFGTLGKDLPAVQLALESMSRDWSEAREQIWLDVMIKPDELRQGTSGFSTQSLVNWTLDQLSRTDSIGLRQSLAQAYLDKELPQQVGRKVKEMLKQPHPGFLSVQIALYREGRLSDEEEKRYPSFFKQQSESALNLAAGLAENISSTNSAFSGGGSSSFGRGNNRQRSPEAIAQQQQKEVQATAETLWQPETVDYFWTRLENMVEESEKDDANNRSSAEASELLQLVTTMPVTTSRKQMEGKVYRYRRDFEGFATYFAARGSGGAFGSGGSSGTPLQWSDPGMLLVLKLPELVRRPYFRRVNIDPETSNNPLNHWYDASWDFVQFQMDRFEKAANSPNRLSFLERPSNSIQTAFALPASYGELFLMSATGAMFLQDSSENQRPTEVPEGLRVTAEHRHAWEYSSSDFEAQPLVVHYLKLEGEASYAAVSNQLAGQFSPQPRKRYFDKEGVPMEREGRDATRWLDSRRMPGSAPGRQRVCEIVLEKKGDVDRAATADGPITVEVLMVEVATLDPEETESPAEGTESEEQEAASNGEES